MIAYEILLMLDPEVPEDRQAEIVAGARSAIETSGTLVGEHDWGVRRLAYEIDHRGEAAYHLFQFEGERELLERLGHSLKIADGVLRFRIIRLKPGSPPPPTPRPDPPRAREEPAERPVAARAAADAGEPAGPSAEEAPGESAGRSPEEPAGRSPEEPAGRSPEEPAGRSPEEPA